MFERVWDMADFSLPRFGMLVADGECIECNAPLPRGSIVWQKEPSPWWRLRWLGEPVTGRSGAWYYAAVSGAVEVCQARAAAELLPLDDERVRQRIVEGARAAFSEHTRKARVAVDGITWVATVRLESAEWLMASVRQTEVLPGCHLWGLARWTPEAVELEVDGLSSRLRRALEHELWLELRKELETDTVQQKCGELFEVRR